LHICSGKTQKVPWEQWYNKEINQIRYHKVYIGRFVKNNIEKVKITLKIER